jgi:hypothetical protein
MAQRKGTQYPGASRLYHALDLPPFVKVRVTRARTHTHTRMQRTPRWRVNNALRVLKACIDPPPSNPRIKVHQCVIGFFQHSTQIGGALYFAEVNFCTAEIGLRAITRHNRTRTSSV